MKRIGICVLLLGAVAFPSFAAAGDVAIEPRVSMSWSFGAGSERAVAPALSFGLYPSDLGWRRLWLGVAGEGSTSAPPAPALLDLRFDASRGSHFSVATMGVPLDAADGDARGNRGLRVGAIVLAAGATTALLVVAIGNAWGDAIADGFDRAGAGGDSDDDAGDQGGITCVNGQCVLPCGNSGPINSCNGG